MPHQKPQKQISYLKRLIWAEQSMKLCIYGCHELLRWCEQAEGKRLTESGRRRIGVMSAGIAALYSSPFTEGNGLGKLELQFSQFEDSRLQSLHDDMIERMRNQLYIHRDLRSAGTTADGSPVKAHRIVVRIDSLGKVEMRSTFNRWKSQTVQKMLALREYQQERILQETVKEEAALVQWSKKFAKKRPGKYVLGEDFP